jgi:hypothetical protein
VFNPRGLRKTLARFGFSLKKIRITGHHPERFRGVMRSNGLRGRIAGIVSRIAGLGDTFEIYAVKRGQE